MTPDGLKRLLKDLYLDASNNHISPTLLPFKNKSDPEHSMNKPYAYLCSSLK